LWEARAQLDEQRIVYKLNLAAFNEKAAEFEKTKQMFQGLGQLVQGSGLIAGMTPVPDPGPGPVEPPLPSLPQPNPADYGGGEDDPAYQQALEAYNNEQNNYKALKETYDAHQMRLSAYQQYTTAIAPVM
ncbi:MAG: hypothetical protein IJZ91_00145, partial [Oscillospiraceae bacterium]|nr:hypothetical protein [Oscillospiraceae bacterium]